MTPERIAQLEQMLERGTICKGHIAEMLDAIKKALVQTEQEPVATMTVKGGLISFAAKILADGTYDLYTTPPQRKPLTDEQIEPIAIDVLGYGALRKQDMELFTEAVRAVEAAHGIKENT